MNSKSVRVFRMLPTVVEMANARLKIGSQWKINVNFISRHLGMERFYSTASTSSLINDERRKYVPPLVYLYNPIQYIRVKLSLWQLKKFCDSKFDEKDFKDGSKQAAEVIINLIRMKDWPLLRAFTTPIGLENASREILNSHTNPFAKLVSFKKEHLRRALPLRVSVEIVPGRRYVYVVMVFVGIRNVLDFDSKSEMSDVEKLIDKLNVLKKDTENDIAPPLRVLYAEFVITFRVEVPNEDNQSDSAEEHKEPSWLVHFYKVCSFRIINYNSVSTHYNYNFLDTMCSIFGKK